MAERPDMMPAPDSPAVVPAAEMAAADPASPVAVPAVAPTTMLAAFTAGDSVSDCLGFRMSCKWKNELREGAGEGLGLAAGVDLGEPHFDEHNGAPPASKSPFVGGCGFQHLQ